MALALTEKVRQKLNGGVEFCVWEVTGLAAGTNYISAEALGLNYVTIAEYRVKTGTLCVTLSAGVKIGGSTSPAVMGTYFGKTIAITNVDNSGDKGSIRAYGY
uniref:Uncharacterized protein n=1 Tax=viral metagenome TaxID=1070528 RepID=A0A6H1ZTI6_9ZZZZ